MFEKEAEEYASQGGLSKEKHFFGVKAIAFKDGAEFGYNKTEKELVKAKEIIKTLIDDLAAADGEQIRELKEIKEVEQFLKEVSE